MNIIKKVKNFVNISNILLTKVHDIKKFNDGIEIIIDRSVAIRINGDVDVTLDGNFNIDTLPPYVINLNSRESIHVRHTELALKHRLQQIREMLDNIKIYREYIEQLNNKGVDCAKSD